MWIIALDDLLEDRTNYENSRNSDHQGRLLKGLRYGRNRTIHGDVVVDVAGAVDMPNPAANVLVITNASSARVIVPPPARLDLPKDLAPTTPRTRATTARDCLCS